MHRRFARALILGSSSGKGPISKRAQFQGAQSAYDGDAVERIDLQAALNLVADVYDISKNPADYIFAVARAVTAELSPDRPNPNENGDAFPREELLRFDHRLAKKVYRTFDLKPNHLNHRADNPLTARGFVLDSSYNVSDPDDQYVECLLAIDASKDPVYAEGIRKGAIDAFSMGCVAEFTICSICANKATNRYEFCRHIAGNKMKRFDGKLAYERCGGVCYEELSAVDQPADPRALMQEILSIRAQLGTQAKQDLGTESEILMLKSKLMKLEQQLHTRGVEAAQQVKEGTMTTTQKTAQAAPPARAPAVPPAPPQDDEMIPFAGANDMPVAFDDTVTEDVPPAQAGAPPAPGMEGYKDRKEDEEPDQLSNDEIGVMNVAARKLTPRFVRRYAFIKVEMTKGGNFRVFDSRTGKGVCVVKPPVKVASRKKVYQFGDTIIRTIAHYGLDGAIRQLRAVPYPKAAQVLEHKDDNLTDDWEAQKPSGEEAEDNLTDPLGEGSSDSASEADSDRQESAGEGPSSAIDDRVNNMQDAQAVTSDSLGSTDEPESDKRDEPEEQSIGGDGLLGEEVHDHEERVAKLAAFYQRKVAAQEKAFAAKLATLEARVEKLATQKVQGAMQRFERCLRIASTLQQTNREESPLKIAMADALLTPFDLDEQTMFPGIETSLTATLVERGMQEGMPVHLAALVARAKELYTMDDRVLQDSEKNLRHAITVPVLTQSPTGDSRSARAEEVEQRALEGNPVLRTAGEIPTENEEEADERRMALRASLSRPSFVRSYEAQRALGPLSRPASQ